MRSLLLVSVVVLLLAAPSATAAELTQWPPAEGPGTLFVHFGEEHLDDADGGRIFPKVIEESARYRPAAVLTSSDKASNGTAENLTAWRTFMAKLDGASIPYFAAVGNHDRAHRPGFPEGIDPMGSLEAYFDVFAGRPYPFGDAPPVADPRFAPAQRPADDPAGASTRYTVDIANTRWIFLDNSCFSFINCDSLQRPAFPDANGDRGQLEYLARQAREGGAQGKRVFVVMHMPTQDPRPGHTEPTPGPHTMGEGTSPDNASFESVAAATGVDGVFAGHIKGQWTYEASGVPYFTDGGAGGEVYVGAAERPGVDFGYWHGFRLVRVGPDGSITTDAVPIFTPGSLAVSGPDRLDSGTSGRWTAKGRQLTEQGPDVELELRAPSPDRPNRVNLPTPAFMWATSDPLVLTPIAGAGDDPRRDPATQTQSGRFATRCPGRASIVVRSGHDGAARSVTVASRPGPLLGRVRVVRRVVRRGMRTTLATATVPQAAIVQVRVRRSGRTIRTLSRTCEQAGTMRIGWNGRGRVRAARLGRYTVEVRVLSDRAPVVRRFAIRTR